MLEKLCWKQLTLTILAYKTIHFNKIFIFLYLVRTAKSVFYHRTFNLGLTNYILFETVMRHSDTLGEQDARELLNKQHLRPGPAWGQVYRDGGRHSLLLQKLQVTDCWQVRLPWLSGSLAAAGGGHGRFHSALYISQKDKYLNCTSCRTNIR